MKAHTSPLLCFLLLLSTPLLAAEPTAPLTVRQQWAVNLNEGAGPAPSAWRILDLLRWREFWGQSLRREPPPAPDFEHCSIVVVTAGERPTGGYRVEVVRALKEADQWVIEFVVRKPAPDSFVTQALTYPTAVAVFSGQGIFRPQVRDVTPPEKSEKHRSP